MTTDTPALEATVETTEAEPVLNAATETPETGEANSVDALPDWAQKVITDARKEAAKYRTEKTKAEKEAEKAARATAEKQGEYQRLYEETKVQLEDANRMAETEKLLRLKATIAHKMNLPALLAERLQGETLEELEADAKVLLDAMPKAQPITATDSNAGVNGRQVTPQKSDREIQELAARLGVRFEDLKKQFIKE